VNSGGKWWKMFNGRYSYAIEEKGRVFVPVKFRRGLSPEAEDTFVITRGFDGCLAMYPLDRWREFEEQLGELPASDPEARRIVRWFSANAEYVRLDSQGRIRIPNHLLEFAQLDSGTVIIGVLDRIEIWNPGAYEKQEKESDPTSMHLEGFKF